jgi:RNA polymerase sigma factor (sigma-70 family)
MTLTHGRLSLVLRQVARSTKALSAGVGDTQLLDRFVELRDETAFELLVWRHQRMVLSVCRRILRREQDAEDAFQATFLALACKAGSISKREAVASWLFKVAYRVACRERLNQEKRIRQAQRVATWRAGDTFPAASTEAMESDVRTALHEEINRLPEVYRASVVLCYLEGKTNEEAALQMSCPTGTVVTWLARARRRLRTRLERRGVALSSGCLLTALAAGDSAAGPPPAFANQTVRAALHFAANPAAPGVVSPKVVALTRGVLEAMVMTKLKIVIAVLLLIGLVSTGSGVFAFCSLPLDEPTGRSAEISPISVVRLDNVQPDKTADPKKTKPGIEPAKDVQEKKDHAKTHTAKEVVTQSFKVGKSPKVIVELYNGGIEIESTGEMSVEAQVTKQGQGKTDELAKQALKSVEVKMSQDGDTVRIQEIKKDDRASRDFAGSATAVVKVPAGATLQLNTMNGAVTINGGTGEIKVHTTNGAIKASATKGALELRTSNGAISVKGATGPVDLKALNGPIDLEGENVAVKAETVNGSLRFQGSLAMGEHTFRSINGEVAVTLPAGSAFRLEAGTTVGRIKNEFGPDGASGIGKTTLRTTVGQNPVVDIRLHTVNGNIAVRGQEAKK